MDLGNRNRPNVRRHAVVVRAAPGLRPARAAPEALPGIAAESPATSEL
jgi:hypothetical protein